VESLLSSLREFDALRDGPNADTVQSAVLDAVSPTYDSIPGPEWLSPAVAQTLVRNEINDLYVHQAEAIRQAREGHNIVLQAPTAGGKSLSFQVPMLDTLVREPGSHALMIYPTKALAFDQRAQLERLAQHIERPRIEWWWYDGDVSPEERRVLRENPPDILITNPEMINGSFLAHSKLWNKVLDGLKWVIVDEVHEYRGYFGSNVAMILRRLSHHLAKRGARPQFFLCSATCSNAREHAENLTGLPFVEINAHDFMRPHRRYHFVNPKIPDHRYWDILQLRVVNSGLACMARGRSVLVFCPTRAFAESCHRKASRRVEELRESGVTDFDLDAIRVFRGGLSSEMRQDIQDGLRSGSVRLVFTTNALELGIDIGGLDGVILAGFPDSMMSAWQRIGRAGRS